MYRLRLPVILSLVVLAFVIGIITGCGGDSGGDNAAVDNKHEADREAITAMLDEMMARFKYRDKAALYENELEFLKEQYTFDRYRKHSFIRGAQADSVYSFKILDIKFFDRDSALVSDEVTLKGPSGESKVINNEYMVYYSQGRWTKPTIGYYSGQIEYEEKKAASGK